MPVVGEPPASAPEYGADRLFVWLRHGADQAAADPAGRTGERVRFPCRARDTESGAQAGCEEGEERARAAHLHLQQQRLALVQHHSPGRADRLEAPFRRQALVVERVARLVDDGHQ